MCKANLFIGECHKILAVTDLFNFPVFNYLRTARKVPDIQ